MARSKKEKQEDCESSEIYEQLVKKFYKENVTNSSLKIFSPKEILNEWWTPSFDLREGDLWLTYNSSIGENFLRRIDVKHQGWIAARSIHLFATDEDHFYLIWNDKPELSYIVPGRAVHKLYTSFEEEEICPFIKKLPKSDDIGFNLNDFDRRFTFRSKTMLLKDIENINTI